VFFVVVVVHVVVHLCVELGAVFNWVEFQVVVLDGFPKAFNPDVVCCTSFAVHGDGNAHFVKGFGPYFGSADISGEKVLIL
jgi:hypothetical protein